MRTSSLPFSMAAVAALGFAAALCVPAPAVGQATVRFVQATYAAPQSAQSSVSVPFTAAQSAGNLNVVIVGWNDTTASVASVTDARGNTYTLAVGPTTFPGQATQAIYFAAGIVAAPTNTVTVAFTSAARDPDVRVLEYSGVDQLSPLNATAAASGSSTTSSSGSLTTSAANVLLVAGNVVQTSTRGAGTGFTSRLITRPDGDIAEDRIVSAVGTYSATASLQKPGYWVMQMAAFKAAGTGSSDTTAPTVAITTPTSASTYSTSTSPISLGGTASDNVGVTQVTWTNSVGGSGAATGTTSWTAGGIALQAGTNVLTVTARDAAGNGGTATLTVTYTATSTDTTPPTVSITAPPTGATVSGTTTVTATASDNVGVVGVQFLVDGAALGAEQTSGYSVSWNTTATSNGSHTLSARARDAAGNTALAPSVSVTVSNSTGQTPGLVAAYAFNEGSGSTVTDVSGNGNTGTIGGATWTPGGKFGGALVFNGSARVTINDAASLRLTSAMTLEAWVNPSAVTSTWRDVVYKGDDNYFLEATSTNGGVPGAGGTFGGVDVVTYGTSLVPVNAWTHLAATYDGSALRLYVNGTLSSTLARTGNIVTSSNPLQIGGDGIYGQFFQGIIDEVRVYSRALSQAEIQTDMTTPVGGTPPPDPTPPTVTMTSPADGSTVFSSVSVSASAADNVGVAGVQFLLDGSPLGAEVSSPPYSVVWDPSTTSTGSHTLSATARDGAGNRTTSAAVHVTATTPTPALVGQWASPVTWPIVAVHANMLTTGQVLASDGQSAGYDARLWNPATGAFTSVPNNQTNIFCSGHCALPDGRVIVAGGHGGGHIGVPDTNVFDPTMRTWTKVASMHYPRWYPTTTRLPDGRVLVTAGEINCGGCVAAIPEIYDSQANAWTALASSASLNLPYYPHMFVLPDGRVLAASTAEDSIVSHVLDLGTQTWSVVDPSAVDGGSAAMYLPGKVIKSGTSADPDLPSFPSARTTYVLDMTQPSPAWRETSPMAFARTYHNLTLLPDGSVLATGGGPTTDAVGVSSAIRQAEMWSPVTETWTTMAAMQKPRLYHSTALLLPDARVLALGGGRFNGLNEPTDQLSSETYSPPYLFKGSRPTITSAPSSATYGATITVQTPDAARIGAVSLVSFGSVTHAFNQNQRFVALPFAAVTGAVQLQIPASANVAPPGYYMLFILDTSGVPSVATTVRLQ